MAERPVETIARAIEAEDRVEASRLLAAAGLAQGLPDFARSAAGNLVGKHEIGAVMARAAWLQGNAAAAAKAWGSLDAGKLDHAMHFEAAQAHWLAGALDTALSHAEAAIAQSDDLPLRDARRLKWFASYLKSLLQRAEDEDTFGHAALHGRWHSLPPDNRPVIALLDYKAPDLLAVSDNIGDFIQSAAALRHLARLDGVEWSFDCEGLAKPLQRMQRSWTVEQRMSIGKPVHLAVADRDDPFSLALRFPGRPVWTIHNGWFFHKCFGALRAMPGPDNLYPLLVSFHLWRPGDLTGELLDWLRLHQPVGCRDKVTMRWLLNQGVDAFFSGCLTLTLATGGKAGKREGDYDVDLDEDTPDGRTTIAHKMPETRTLPYAESLAIALDLIDQYAAARTIRTSRLHCALPAWAVGTAVDFRLPNPADRRFDGLVDAGDAARKELRKAMVSHVGWTVRQIALGKKPRYVRDVWAKRWAGAVEAAREEVFGGNAPPTIGLVSAAMQDLRPEEPVTIVMAFDEKYLDKAKVALRSVRENSMAPIRLVLLVRRLGKEEVASLVNAIEPVETRILPMDGRMKGVEVELLQQITISTMDRLFLDEILPDLDRVVYLDCDIIVNGDIAELAGYGPGAAGIAARPTPNPNVRTLVEMSERRAMKLDEGEARALREYAARALDLRQKGFNAGVLVLSLDRLRENGMLERARGLAERFGLHDQDALNLAATGGYAALPDRWNAMPHLDFDPEPAIVHWVGARKPWMKPAVRHQHFWHRYADLPDIGKAHWRKADSYRPDWDDRAKLAAKWIAPGTSVLDLGSGGRLALGRYLASDCRYQPADLRAWTLEVIPIDLDRGDFPDGPYDAVAMLGLLEYLQDPAVVLRRACEGGSAALITSFCHPQPDADWAFRHKRGWINAFDESEFEAMLNEAGWSIEERTLLKDNENICEMLYRCAPAE